VKTANVTGIGAILTDGDGMTLYVFANDAANKSACYGACAQNWPPVLVTDQIVIPKGIPGTFRFIIRNDSTNQVTYNDMPLYRYASDGAPGDTNGEGVAGKWHVAQP
jgi:predicted lipoprotein with Yx(FWY)xxD motif